MKPTTTGYTEMQPYHWKWILYCLTASLIVSGCKLFKSSYPFKGKTIGAIDKSNAIPAEELFQMDHISAKKYIGKEITISGLRPSKIWMEDTTAGHTTCEFSFSRVSDSGRIRWKEVRLLFVSNPEDLRSEVPTFLESPADTTFFSTMNIYSNELSPCFLKKQGFFNCDTKLDSTGITCPFDPIDLYVSGRVVFSGGDSADQFHPWYLIATGLAN